MDISEITSKATASITQPANKLYRLGGGIDSLSQGANGGPPSSYLDTAIANLRLRYGDGGLGCWPCQLASRGFNLNGFGKTSGVGYVDSLSKSDAIATATPSLQGLYTTGGAGSDSWTYAPQSGDGHSSANITWTSVRIGFILRSSGSSFRLKENNGVDGSSITIDNTNFEVGVPQFVTYYAGTNGSDQRIKAWAITGDVTFATIEFQNSALSGVTMTNFGRGGVLASEWAAMDAAINRAWWAGLQLDAFLLKAGMNDRGSRSALQVARNVEQIVDRIQTGSPKTKIILIRCNDSSDAGSTALQHYDRAFRSIALSRGLAYYDERDALGAYAAALSAGYMDGVDGVHPTSLGKSTNGQYIASRIIL